MMMKDLFKTQIIEHMKHSLLIRVEHGYKSAPIITNSSSVNTDSV